MHHPTDRITHTTSFITPVMENWLEREVAQWLHYEGSIQRWANALTAELHLAPNAERCQLGLPWVISDITSHYPQVLPSSWTISDCNYDIYLLILLSPASKTMAVYTRGEETAWKSSPAKWMPCGCVWLAEWLDKMELSWLLLLVVIRTLFVVVVDSVNTHSLRKNTIKRQII